MVEVINSVTAGSQGAVLLWVFFKPFEIAYHHLKGVQRPSLLEVK